MKLSSLNEKYSTTLTNNITLTERNDILFKLSKSYLDRYELKTDSVSQAAVSTYVGPPNAPPSNGNSIESTTTNSTGVNTENTDATSTSTSLPNIPVRAVDREPDNSGETSNNVNTINATSNDSNNKSNRYCHFYSNFGSCHFEQRTGKQCRYQHKVAPVCKSGMNCSRNKCMFSHPKPQQQENKKI